MRILIVDDVPLICDLLAGTLRHHGYEPYTCVNGGQVLEMVERLRPEVLLLDIAMPDANGLDLAEQINQHPDLRPKRIVAVTGYNDPVMRQKIAAAGFDHHLVKPVGWYELQTVLPAAS